MKPYIIILSFVAAFTAHAAPYDTVISRRDGSNTPGTVTIPNPGVDAMYMFNNTTHQPDVLGMSTFSKSVVQAANASALATLMSGVMPSTSDMNTALAFKLDTPAGTTAQYIRGDGTLSSFPTSNSAFTNGAGYLVASDLSPYATTSAVNTLLGSYTTTSGLTTLLAGKLNTGITTLAGYGITDPVVLTSGGYANPAWITSLAYSKLTGTPNIPAAQVNSDWSAGSGLAQILNKPTTVAGYGITDALKVPTITASVSHTLTTVATDNTKTWQMSSTRPSHGTYAVKISVTSTIGGPSEGNVILEVCSTNSTTAGDWVALPRTSNGQTITLAVVLNSVQPVTSTVSGWVPAGWYVRLRTVAVSGSPTFTYDTGEEAVF